MNRPSRSGAARPRPGRRRRPAVVVTALTTLLLGAVGQLTGQPAAAAAEAHADNPFAGADFYVNPDYAARVDTSIAQTSDAALRSKMEQVGTYPTAVWLDRIAAIHGGDANAGRKSLADHLDLALAQKKPGRRSPPRSWCTTCPAGTARPSPPTANCRSPRPVWTATRASTST
ncbi:hypothetical protein [Streptomyces phaeoluteigriseus]|uniref:hypothetical protein n=1 Tax=Streptomyces phaeoluteigriseus TaxID=114686 RepID=UPI003182DF8B